MIYTGLCSGKIECEQAKNAAASACRYILFISISVITLPEICGSSVFDLCSNCERRHAKPGISASKLWRTDLRAAACPSLAATSLRLYAKKTRRRYHFRYPLQVFSLFSHPRQPPDHIDPGEYQKSVFYDKI